MTDLLVPAEADAGTLAAAGRWTIDNAAALDAALRAMRQAPAGVRRVDLANVAALDTAGALLLLRAVGALRAEGHVLEVVGQTPAQAALLDAVAEADPGEAEAPAPRHLLTALVARVGARTVAVFDEAARFTGFLGQMAEALFRVLPAPGRLRVTSLVHHMETAGIKALPIVGLMSFLIGVVMAYQGAVALQRFGAEIFVVDLVAVSILRELGILLTAIVVAGRSGSAFTAQIGSMKLREEIDAMRALGIDPMQALVVPRVLALVLTLPLLAFFANMMGLLGGGIMAWADLGIAPSLFVDRLGETDLNHLLVGLVKAPFFAAMIALIGCFNGLQVSGSAESVGQRTTASVVQAIFAVIVADALFSVMFSLFGF